MAREPRELTLWSRRGTCVGLWGACIGFAYPFCVSFGAKWLGGLPYGLYSDSLDTVAWFLGGAALYSIVFVLVPIVFRVRIGDRRPAVMWGASLWMGSVLGVHAGHKVWRGWRTPDGWGFVEFVAVMVIGGMIAGVVGGWIWRGGMRFLGAERMPR
jgi:hypothetical protein